MLKNIQLLNPGIVALPFIGNSDKPSMLGAYNFMYPTQQQLQKTFSYKEGNLYWKIKHSKSINIGQQAGCYHAIHNRRVIRFDGKLYKQYTLIWIWHNGEIPSGKVIDHIDRNCANDRIDNLRVCTQRENTMNQSLSKANTSGYKGITYDKERGNWQASIFLNYKRKFLGRYSTKEDAAIAYNNAASKYYGQFANKNIIPNSFTAMAEKI
jgi:hypothetical protein